jgi:WD40 repeat protein
MRTFIEHKDLESVEHYVTFTTSAKAYCGGEECIVVGTSRGEIFHVDYVDDSFSKNLAFTLKDESAITAMVSDENSKHLAVGNANGYVILFKIESNDSYKPIATITPDNEVPITTLGCLFRGNNLVCAGFQNGHVKLLNFENGDMIAEISSHSRMVNAVACHPSRAVFATCGDDTFMNVYEVSGDKIEKLDVDLILSSRVNDLMLVGVTFGGENNSSVVGVPYDFNTLVVWDNVV